MMGEKNAERKTEDVVRGWREKSEYNGAQTPRLLAPVGTPGETGVRRPDGRKSEAGEGAGPGSGGITGNPVARSERKEHKRHLDVGAVLGSKRCGCDIQGPGVTP